MLQATIAAVLINGTTEEVCRENHWDSVYVFTPWWSYHHNVSDGIDLHLLVKLIHDCYPLCLGHCKSHYQYIGKVAEYKKNAIASARCSFWRLFFVFCEPFFSLVLESGSSTTDGTAGRFIGANDGS